MAETVRVKEKYGLVESMFFPITAEPDGQHPTYGTMLDLGAAVKAYLSLTFSEAPAYGDDVEQLNIREFVSGALDAETLLSDLEVDAALYGSTMDETTGLTDKAADNPNPGAYAYIQKLKTRAGTVFRGVFLYYVVPAMTADNSDTKGGSITYMNNTVRFAVQTDKTGAWRSRDDFDTQQAAHEYLVGLAAGSAAAAES